MPQRIGGLEVCTHIVPPAVVAAGERGAFGMRGPRHAHDSRTWCATSRGHLDEALRCRIRKANFEKAFGRRLTSA